MKRFKSIFLSLTVMFSLMPANVMAANQSDSMEHVRYTVLALDTSGSMEGEPMNAAKDAAIRFCDAILNADGTNQVALITLNSSSSVICEFTDDLDAVSEQINNLNASGGTNVDDALICADSMLKEIDVPNSIKNIVLLSDGLPESGPSSADGPYTRDDYSGYQYANNAYNDAQRLKQTNYIYTLGFFHSLTGSNLDFGRRFLSDIQNAGYYDVTEAEELDFVFGDIADEIITDNSKCPIIVIPGIMGSRLYEDQNCNNRIWEPSIAEGIWNALAYPFTDFANKMPYGNTLYVNNNNVNQVTAETREYGAQDTYKTLVDMLCDTYPDREVYVFSYDFREDNAESAKELNSLIEDVIGDEWTKVDIICHSMGGLVASSYVKQFGDECISHIITMGTPYEGAPKLVNAVLNWDALTNRYEDNDHWWGFNLSTISDSALGLAGLTKEVKAGFPSIAQLAPTENMFDDYYYYRRHRGGFLWSNISDYVISYDDYKGIMNNIFGNNFSKAEDFHSSIKNDEDINILTSMSNSYFAVGIDQPTIGALVFNEGDSLSSLECVDLLYEYDGDGTVPYLSSTMDEHTNDFGYRFLEVNDDHTGIVSNQKVLDWIKDVLSRNYSEITNDEGENIKYIVIRIACPVDVNIERNGEVLSSDVLEGSFKTSFGCIDFLGSDSDIKMLCLRADETDIVNLVGTDDGTMDLTIRWYDEDSNLTAERAFEDVNITADTLMTTTTDGSEPTALDIDENGDGTVDSSITATEYYSEDSQIILKIGEKEAQVFGETKVNDVAPQLVNDRAMLPIRFIAEELGDFVIWDEANRKVTISNDENEIVIYIDSDRATVNGNTVELDSPAFIENDRTFLPLRFVSENLGADVEWDEQAQTITITK